MGEAKPRAVTAEKPVVDTFRGPIHIDAGPRRGSYPSGDQEPGTGGQATRPDGSGALTGHRSMQMRTRSTRLRAQDLIKKLD